MKSFWILVIVCLVGATTAQSASDPGITCHEFSSKYLKILQTAVTFLGGPNFSIYDKILGGKAISHLHAFVRVSEGHTFDGQATMDLQLYIVPDGSSGSKIRPVGLSYEKLTAVPCQETMPSSSSEEAFTERIIPRGLTDGSASVSVHVVVKFSKDPLFSSPQFKFYYINGTVGADHEGFSATCGRNMGTGSSLESDNANGAALALVGAGFTVLVSAIVSASLALGLY